MFLFLSPLLSSLILSFFLSHLSFLSLCPPFFYPLLFLLSLFPRLSVPSVSLPRTRAHAFTGFFILWLCRFVQERGVARLSVTFFMVALISRCIVNYDFVSLTLTCIFPLRLFLMNRNSCLCLAREFTAAQPREASSRTPTSVGGRPDSAWVVVVVSGCQCPRIPRLLLVCGLCVCVCVRARNCHVECRAAASERVWAFRYNGDPAGRACTWLWDTCCRGLNSPVGANASPLAAASPLSPRVASLAVLLHGRG